VIVEAQPEKPREAECASRLKVLADRTRLAVLEALLERPRHVHEMVELLGVEQSLLSHHLRVLRDAGFVEADRDGKSMCYRLAPDAELADAKRGIDLGCCALSFPLSEQENA
jgi:ArsR family transcriptional regulator, nickel/cobalt-responsive transcriptional repressor